MGFTIFTSPFFLILAFGPLLFVAWIYSLFHRWAKKKPSTERNSLKYGALCGFIVLTGYTLLILYIVIFSHDVQAAFALINIFVFGAPLTLIVAIITSALFFTILRRKNSTVLPVADQHTSYFSRGRMYSFIAWLVIILSLLWAGKYFYSDYLQRSVKSSTSPEEIRAVYANMWTRYDVDVLNTIARHELTPSDILKELAFVQKGYVRSGVARHPSTPVETLIFLYENQDPEKYSKGYLLYDLAVNPSVPLNILIELSKSDDKIVRNNVASNPNLPPNILCTLAKEPSGIVLWNAERNIKKRNIVCQ